MSLCPLSKSAVVLFEMHSMEVVIFNINSVLHLTQWPTALSPDVLVPDVELAPKYGALLPVSRYSRTHAKTLRHTCMLSGPGARDDPDAGMDPIAKPTGTSTSEHFCCNKLKHSV